MTTTKDKQQQTAIERTQELLVSIQEASNENELKTAVSGFITAMDVDAHVLGDKELCELAGQSLKRRNKQLTARPPFVMWFGGEDVFPSETVHTKTA